MMSICNRYHIFRRALAHRVDEVVTISRIFSVFDPFPAVHGHAAISFTN